MNSYTYKITILLALLLGLSECSYLNIKKATGKKIENCLEQKTVGLWTQYEQCQKCEDEYLLAKTKNRNDTCKPCQIENCLHCKFDFTLKWKTQCTECKEGFNLQENIDDRVTKTTKVTCVERSAKRACYDDCLLSKEDCVKKLGSSNKGLADDCVLTQKLLCMEKCFGLSA